MLVRNRYIALIAKTVHSYFNVAHVSRHPVDYFTYLSSSVSFHFEIWPKITSDLSSSLSGHRRGYDRSQTPGSVGAGSQNNKIVFFELLKKGWDQTFDFVPKESVLTVDNSKSPKCITFLIDTDLLLYCSYSLDYISLSLLFSLWLTLMSCLGSSECYSSFHSNANSSPIYFVVFLTHSTL